MNAKRIALVAVLLAGLGSAPLLYPVAARASDATALQPKEGWYKELVNFDFVRANVDIPLKKGVTIIDSRPVARQYDPGHIPGAISIPDSQFDKLADRLPQDKASLLIFYCGGLQCMLSHNSAFKAQKLGYTSIKVYAEGMPDWQAKGGPVAVSAAYISKLISDKAVYTLVDARPKRVAGKGMIPTAINISDTEFDKNVDKLPADKAQLLIYYCGGLECVLSDKSAGKARALGYTKVVTYPEGYPEWAKLHAADAASAGAGGPAAAGVAAADPAKAGPTLVQGKEKGVATVDSFKEVWTTKPDSILLVDVRDAKEFETGTIKGAVNIPMNDLEKKLASLPRDKAVVFICGTGARSGEAYDMVKMLASDIQAWFLDADIKFAVDGNYMITAKN